MIPGVMVNGCWLVFESCSPSFFWVLACACNTFGASEFRRLPLVYFPWFLYMWWANAEYPETSRPVDLGAIASWTGIGLFLRETYLARIASR